MLALESLGEDPSVERAQTLISWMPEKLVQLGPQRALAVRRAMDTARCARTAPGREVASDLFVYQRGPTRWVVSEVRGDGAIHRVGEVEDESHRFRVISGTQRKRGPYPSLLEAARSLSTLERRHACDFSAFSPAKQRLIADAQDAGYEVERDGAQVEVVRRHKRTGSILQGIVLYQDGTAIRCDVDISIATGMRSNAEMRDVLSLPAASGPLARVKSMATLSSGTTPNF